MKVPVLKSDNPLDIYGFILKNISIMPKTMLDHYLTELELSCYSTRIKAKFNDNRSIADIKTILKQELLPAGK
jgi:hypothetical protein